MDDTVARLTDIAWDLYQKAPSDQRILIAIAGVPGSGKTTLSALVASSLNARATSPIITNNPTSATSSTTSKASNISPPALVLPLDGFHLTRAQLSRLPNAQEAHYRRGAEFTFDGEAYLSLVRSLRSPIPDTDAPTIHAPSFDHATKDPIANDIPIPPSARVILLEGLYLALSRPPWSEAAALMDALWFIDVPLPMAEERCVKRNFEAGLSKTLGEARKRWEESDGRNAREVVRNRVGGCLVVGGWGGEEEEQGSKGPRMSVADRGRMDSIAEMAASGVGL